LAAIADDEASHDSGQFAWLQRFSVAPVPAFSRQVKAVAAEAGFAAEASKLYGRYALQFRLTRN
jgi:hypothetical protein